MSMTEQTMDWDRVARFLEQKAAFYQDAANTAAVVKGHAKSRDRNDTLAEVARLLAGAIRFGTRNPT